MIGAKKSTNVETNDSGSRPSLIDRASLSDQGNPLAKKGQKSDRDSIAERPSSTLRGSLAGYDELAGTTEIKKDDLAYLIQSLVTVE